MTIGRSSVAACQPERRSGPTEYRDLGLLKFFFSELAQPGDVIALAHEQAAAQRAQQARWEGIIARFSNRPELAARVRSAELGTRLARTAAAFWEEVVERQAQADAA